MHKRFKSSDGTDKRIALMDGHVTVIGGEWTDVHERFHSAAYSAGCVSEDMVKNKAIENLPTKQAEQVIHRLSLDERIQEAIHELVTENKLDAFNKGGVPDARIISTMVGERINTGKRDEAWYRYQQNNKDD